MTTVFFDIDTQIDFMYPAGALYVPGAEKIVPRIAALNQHAATQGIQLISTMDAHSEDDPEFASWPHHCVVDTVGQQKPASTLLKDRKVIPNLSCSLDPAPQILLQKQHLDCFTNMNLPALLDRVAADRYVVYGVVTEVCVKFAAFGLLRTGSRVELVIDAVRSLNDEASVQLLAEFVGAGGILTTAAQLN